jgi:hypothetical protein
MAALRRKPARSLLPVVQECPIKTAQARSRKSGSRVSLATNAERVCAEIMHNKNTRSDPVLDRIKIKGEQQ